MMKRREAILTTRILATVQAGLFVTACSLLLPLPALADQVNPQGNTITGQNPGMLANYTGEILTNLGSIIVEHSPASGVANATGMNGNGSTLENSGTITVTANGSTGTDIAYAEAEATGMNGDSSTLENSGTIIVTANGSTANAYATGMRGNSSTLENNGAIIVTANGGIVDTSHVNAIGMRGYDNLPLENNGTITVTANGGTGNANATGMNVSRSMLENNGTITVTANGGTGNAYAYGMYIDAGPAANYGVIKTNATVGAGPEARTHELFVGIGTPDGTVDMTNWALALRDFSEEQTRPFAVDGTVGGMLNFADTNLTLRPGTVEQGFAWGKEYEVKDMIKIYSVGTVSGAVATVKTELPFIKAQLSGDIVDNQRVSLHGNFKKTTDPGFSATMQNATMGAEQARFMGKLLAGQMTAYQAEQGGRGPAAGVTVDAAASKWTGFLTPYYSYANNSGLGYSGKTTGLVGGATYRYSDRLVGGFHLGYNHTQTKGDLLAQNGDTNTLLLGVHGKYDVKPNWYLRGQLTGFYNHSNNDWSNKAEHFPLYSGAKTNGHGLYAEVNTGYTKQLNQHSTLTPELGLAWLWAHQNGYGLQWRDSFGNKLDDHDMDYASTNYQALYGTAMLRWQGEYDDVKGGGKVRPQLALGVRQRLTSGEVKSQVRIAGGSFTTRAGEDRTTALAEAGLEWNWGKNSVGLSYTGEFGSDQKVNTGWLSYKYEF